MQIFISYAREDGQSLAQQLHGDLTARNIRVWMDTSEMAFGKSWERQIEDAIRNSTYVLLVVTPGAFQSEIVQDEIAFANQHRATIIPLYYKSVNEFPLRLLRLHYIDFRQIDGYAESLQILYDNIQSSNLSNLPTISVPMTTPYKNYLQSLIGHLRDLPIERINSDINYSATMDKLWVPIDVDYQESGEANSIRIPALEAISVQHQLLILGDPGSGKSSLLRYVALCLASATLQNTNLSCLDISNIGPMWRRGFLCPVYLELIEFAEYLLRTDKKKRLFDFILEQAEAKSEGFGTQLRQKILNGDCIILLDGLDEVPNNSQLQLSAQISILDFAKSYAGCPIVITSRISAYRQSPLHLSLFKEVEIAPFTDHQIETFLDNWYDNLPPHLEGQKKQKDKLRENIFKDPGGLGELAQQPLLLIFLASVFTFSADMLPTSKSELYQRIIQLMLREWEATRTVVDLETGQLRRVPSSLAEFLGLPESYMLILNTLQELAYNIQSRQMNFEEAAGINVGEIAQRLHLLARRYKKANLDINPYQIEEDISARTGLLQPYGLNSYRFPHRTIQEYLVASYLCRKEHYPHKICELLFEDPPRWHEVLMFIADITVENLGIPCLLPLMDALLTHSEAMKHDAEGESLQMVFHYIGLIITAYNLQILKTKSWMNIIDDARKGLKDLIARRSLSPIVRAEAGCSLGIIGDDRPGVGLRSDKLPDIAWCHIPEGEFIFGDSRNEYKMYLPDFWISKYPITNIQFRPFAEDGGYTEQWRDCWTDVGWKWHQRAGRREPLELPYPFSLENHPRVNIDFFEAFAYCQWLSQKLGMALRLPTEPEWEKAARGPEGLLFPWGETFDSRAANILTARINSSCAVGLFPPSIYGVYDLVGNISEWCITLWDPQYGYPLEDMDNDPEGQYQRIVRGSAYTYSPDKATATYRHWEDPQNRKLIRGFRLVSVKRPAL